MMGLHNGGIAVSDNAELAWARSRLQWVLREAKVRVWATVERRCRPATCMAPRWWEHGGGEPHSSVGMLALALRPSPWARPRPQLSLMREERERESLEEHGHAWAQARWPWQRRWQTRPKGPHVGSNSDASGSRRGSGLQWSCGQGESSGGATVVPVDTSNTTLHTRLSSPVWR
jgi:hypothetical protein